MIKPLTSFRFIFAAMVFLSHCNVLSPFFGQHVFSEGYIGVSFFFVLSGFIIAYSNEQKLRDKTISARSFWVARLARIYPLHLLTLLIVVVLGTGYQGVGTVVDFSKHFIPNLLLLQSFIPSIDYYFSFNSPSWSLSCEVLFYFLFPLLLYLPKRFLKWLCMAAILIVPSCMFLSGRQPIITLWYVNPVVRLADFFVGILLFQLYRSKSNCNWSAGKATLLEIISIAVFVFMYVCLSVYVPQVYRFSCYYWLPVAILIFVFAQHKGFVSHILSYRIMVLGGEISFGFYLFHRVLLDYYEMLELNLSVPVSFVLLLFCLTVLLSWLSFRYFEKPANRWVKRVFDK